MGGLHWFADRALFPSCHRPPLEGNATISYDGLVSSRTKWHSLPKLWRWR